jgi:hypothetical protein
MMSGMDEFKEGDRVTTIMGASKGDPAVVVSVHYVKRPDGSSYQDSVKIRYENGSEVEAWPSALARRK